MTRCHTLKGHVSDHAHRICWMMKRIREKEVDRAFGTQHGPTYLGRRDIKPKIYIIKKCSTSVTRSVKRKRTYVLTKLRNVLKILTEQYSPN